MTLQPPIPSRHRTTDSKERNYQQIRVRQDTNDNWLKNDPMPADGEFCYSLDKDAPPTMYPSDGLPQPTEALLGTFVIDTDYNIYECTSNGSGSYTWTATGQKYTTPEIDPDTGVPYKNQCLKIGRSGLRWSQLPWLGGRGPQGPKGDPGDGVRIVGVLTDCGPPSAEQAPDPQIGDMWVVACEDRTGSTDCMAECDGTAWVWDGEAWLEIGSIQGPPGNNVEYYYQEFAAREGQTEFQLDNRVQVQATFVTINGVILLPNDYTFTDNTYTEEGEEKEGCLLTFDSVSSGIPLKAEDIIMVFSFKGAIDAAVRTLTTDQISTIGVRPVDVPPVERPEIRNQQQVNWYLMDAIDNLEIPEAIELPENIATTDDITAAVEGLATEEWVTNQIDEVEIPSIEGLTTQEYVDAADQAVQRFATSADQGVQNWVTRQNYLVDAGQNAQIETLENKVDALEGTVVEAKYKCDTRDSPSIGSFALQDDNGFKQMYFSTTTKLEFWKSDFTNKVIDFSKVMNGDIIRLVMSPDNYANYTVTGIEIKEQTVQMSVTFGSHGKDQIAFEGSVYDFTHTTPFDVGSAATKQYVDAQDEVTLNAAKEYADSLDIPEAISTDGLLSDTGEQQVQSGWKIKAPGNSDAIWTYLSLANAGEVAINHLRNPTELHHAANKGWVQENCALVNTPMRNDTIIWYNSDGYAGEKMRFSDPTEHSPHRQEKKILYGNYKSNGGELSHWQFGFNESSQYWNYEWVMGSNLTMNWIMGPQNKKVMSVDKNGVDMPAAYIVGEYSLEGVAEDQVEAVKAKAREIDIGHRLRELKKILVNLKTALKTKSADTQQALLDVLENVEDI